MTVMLLTSQTLFIKHVKMRYCAYHLIAQHSCDCCSSIDNSFDNGQASSVCLYSKSAGYWANFTMVDCLASLLQSDL